jgi:hypothetical protein
LRHLERRQHTYHNDKNHRQVRGYRMLCHPFDYSIHG